MWMNYDVDSLTSLYDVEINAVLDSLVLQLVVVVLLIRGLTRIVVTC